MLSYCLKIIVAPFIIINKIYMRQAFEVLKLGMELGKKGYERRKQIIEEE